MITVQGIASGTVMPVSAAALPLPSGAATAAKQPALGTAGTAATDVITVQGIASGTPQPADLAKVAGTTVDTNSGVKSAGTQRVVLATDQPAFTTAMPVQAGGYTVQSVASITRPADTAIYAAKDAVSSSTTAPAILTFTSCARTTGGSGYITKARLQTDQSANVAAYRLHLYDATQTAVNDNAAHTVLWANRASYLGYIDLPAATTDGADTANTQSVQAPFPFVAAGTSLFGMLETISSFTPASAQNFYIQLAIEQN